MQSALKQTHDNAALPEAPVKELVEDADNKKRQGSSGRVQGRRKEAAISAEE